MQDFFIIIILFFGASQSFDSVSKSYKKDFGLGREGNSL